MNLRKDIMHSSYPKRPPYENAADYLLSKAQLHDLRFFRNYEWDKPGHDPIFHLIAGRRVLESTTEKLVARREFSKNENKKLKLQWEDLYDKELKLKDTFEKLSSFIKSNQDKRKRAEQILQDDYQLRMKRTEDIENLTRRVNLVKESKKEMDANISKLKIYEQYLNQVVGASEDFRNADDLIERYESLVNTRNLLGKRQDENLGELETARAKTAKMLEENAFKILGLNTVVATLNSRYSTAFREAVHWENIVLAIRNNSFQKYQEIAQVKQSCWNMYLLMCRRKGEAPKIAEDDFEKQLIYVKKTLQELGTIKELAGRDIKELTGPLSRKKKRVRAKTT